MFSNMCLANVLKVLMIYSTLQRIFFLVQFLQAIMSNIVDSVFVGTFSMFTFRTFSENKVDYRIMQIRTRLML